LATSGARAAGPRVGFNLCCFGNFNWHGLLSKNLDTSLHGERGKSSELECVGRSSVYAACSLSLGNCTHLSGRNLSEFVRGLDISDSRAKIREIEWGFEEFGG
jgi:hypothetical protein